jgi:ribonuclease J
MNCLAIEQGEDIMVVDCGIRFPRDDLGVDVVHPDFTWLRERADRVRGIFVTHGHEDHIGALPYLLQDLEVPVWGPAHALGLVRRRLAEHDYGPTEVELRLAVPRETYEVGSFRVEPVRVAHSIVEASGLRILTNAGTVFHTGDFNFDPDPPDGEPTDEARLTEIGDAGVALLLSDSTNIDVTAPAGSERMVGRALDVLVGDATERVFIALFASNIQRLMLLGEIAQRVGRKIVVLGRSLQMQIEIASDIGRLRWPSNLRIGIDEARTFPKERLLVLAGGTQGEPGSAMSRLAAGTHQDLSIDEGDTVLFSSRVIPGNDVPVSDLVAAVMRRGAKVHTRHTDPSIHTSGHATRDEQSRMLKLVRPRCFLPVHGTLHHLRRHAALAREHGVSSVTVVENGTVVRLDGSSIEAEGRVPCGIVQVGMGGVPLAHDVLKERAELGRVGIATVAFCLDSKGGLFEPVSVSTRGIAGMVDPANLRGLKGEVARAVELSKRRRHGDIELKEEVRRTVRRFLLDVGGVRPAVEVHVFRGG